jgi:NAD(P)-dependent dehydrogenase (short-subunit alcohol dehydrogenase family)
MEELRRHVAVVSGAAGSMGGALAHALADHGVQLALLDLHEDRLQAVCGNLVSSEDGLLLGGIDLTNPVSVDEAVTKILAKFERIDFLLNIAGGYRAGYPVQDTPIDEWDLMFDLNVKSAFLLSRAILPGMIKQRYGKVVNIAAKPGLKGIARSAAYSGSKSAVLRLTESMAAEVKHLGINVNAVIPGMLDTPKNREDSPDLDPARWVSLDSVIDVIMFLLSNQARAVHAAAIVVDGPESDPD